MWYKFNSLITFESFICRCCVVSEKCRRDENELFKGLYNCHFSLLYNLLLQF